MKARFESAECRYKEAEKEALAISKDFEEAQKALRDREPSSYSSSLPPDKSSSLQKIRAFSQARIPRSEQAP